jgi:sulfatase maturation enzyme AslB (radical SAM superfamily)
VCNLACRSCGGWDSNTFAREGEYYAEHYQTTGIIGGEVRQHNRFMQLLPARHMDFMQYRDIAGNLEKIDFYGGEPFLNITQLDLLEYLADQGLSKNITLFYSTNCTNHPTARLKRAWSKFRRVEISMSIDGVGDEFEYLRWPGKWSEAQQVIEHIQRLDSELECEVYTMAGLTVSTLNVANVDATHAWLVKNIGNVYVNMVESPEYLSLHTIPEYVKIQLRQQVKHPEALGYLDLKPSDPAKWRQFLIWTRRQDLYRKQNLATSLPHLYQLIQQDWDATVDLSEQNFNS